ncbi:SET domain-containing protein [Caulifigura coniformis]|uniref:SET domain-containing protein n=1 Tax=Caulifigura coniformis TaxID=2527983 RepID=UPI0018D22279|nr:SET domain-containing protein [Caulifigura coniformis]
MKLNHSDLLEVRKSPGKGRGVFARKDIKKGTTFETVPLIVFDNDECEGAKMATYVFEWTKKTSAIALGYGSLYNHSYEPNARYYDGKHETKEFMAIRDIKAGEEITVNYNGNPKKKDKVDFAVIENSNGHVANGKPQATRKVKRAVPVKNANGKATATRKSRSAAK